MSHVKFSCSARAASSSTLKGTCLATTTLLGCPRRKPTFFAVKKMGLGEYITRKIADEFFGIANGLKSDRFGWLTPVKVNASEAAKA